MNGNIIDNFKNLKLKSSKKKERKRDRNYFKKSKAMSHSIAVEN